MTLRFRVALSAMTLSILFSTRIAAGEQNRMITSSDCVRVRYLSKEPNQNSIALNSLGTRVVYIVKSPNLETNRNNFQLYLSDLRRQAPGARRLILSSDRISQPQWLRDGRHLVVLSRAGGNAIITELDASTGQQRILIQTHQNIREYSIDQEGKVLVYATDDPADIPPSLSEKEEASGFRIHFQKPTVSEFHHSKVFISQRAANGGWTRADTITIHSPFTGDPLTSFSYVGNSYLSLSLAPDGSRMLMTYQTNDVLPASWRQTPFLKKLEAAGFGAAPVLVLYEIKSHKTTLPLQSPRTYGPALWSPDSIAFTVKADTPINAEQRSDRVPAPLQQLDRMEILSVDIKTGAIEVIIPEANFRTQPLAWRKDGDLLVRDSADSIAVLTRRGNVWSIRQSTRIPLPHPYPYSQFASDGTRVVGDYQATMTPPEIFLYEPESSEAETLDDLNPELRGLTFASVRPVDWKTSAGYPIHGLLFLPPDYRAGVRYPLVIQTKPEEGQFICDTGESHYPSFAPQPLASAGILYLIRSASIESDAGHYPQGYPGGIGEAAFHLDIWDSAIESLDQQGLVDPNRIGIIGFSRSGWYTEYILAHSKARYQAATLADNVEYSLGEYWLAHYEWVLGGWDAMYGGPPYGPTLENWMKYSISFNAESIRTPVLMEEMGHGIPYDDRAIPIGLAERYELFTGLNRLKRPVEMYYYPREEHQPDSPWARLATLRRNVDWYRFWLQGYERTNPEDPDQYRRWRRLRDAQDLVPMKAGQTK
jgi:dipeptidyl aminopeptidase/acylaminoacyl peptidase